MKNVLLMRTFGPCRLTVCLCVSWLYCEADGIAPEAGCHGEF